MQEIQMPNGPAPVVDPFAFDKFTAPAAAHQPDRPSTLDVIQPALMPPVMPCSPITNGLDSSLIPGAPIVVKLGGHILQAKKGEVTYLPQTPPHNPVDSVTAQYLEMVAVHAPALQVEEILPSRYTVQPEPGTALQAFSLALGANNRLTQDNNSIQGSVSIIAEQGWEALGIPAEPTAPLEERVTSLLHILGAHVVKAQATAQAYSINVDGFSDPLFKTQPSTMMAILTAFEAQLRIGLDYTLIAAGIASLSTDFNPLGKPLPTLTSLPPLDKTTARASMAVLAVEAFAAHLGAGAKPLREAMPAEEQEDSLENLLDGLESISAEQVTASLIPQAGSYASVGSHAGTNKGKGPLQATGPQRPAPPPQAPASPEEAPVNPFTAALQANKTRIDPKPGP
ncbi:hypothetical protein V8C86DRAFT_3125435 [Haematococcus lacustris]